MCNLQHTKFKNKCPQCKTYVYCSQKHMYEDLDWHALVCIQIKRYGCIFLSDHQKELYDCQIYSDYGEKMQIGLYTSLGLLNKRERRILLISDYCTKNDFTNSKIEMLIEIIGRISSGNEVDFNLYYHGVSLSSFVYNFFNHRCESNREYDLILRDFIGEDVVYTNIEIEPGELKLFFKLLSISY